MMMKTLLTLAMMTITFSEIDVVVSQCVGLPDVPHATPDSISSGPFSDGTVLKFTCNNGYRESGSNPSYTCSGSSWTGGDYKCSLIHCSRIDPPENGRITNSPDFSAGSSVLFSCNPGYAMDGTDTLTCFTYGQWTPISPPTCIVKQCPAFGVITNANIAIHQTDFDDRSFVTVTCHRGYVLAGSNIVRCLETGQWDEKPTCEHVDCPPLPGVNSNCIDLAEFYPPQMYIMMCKEDSDTVSVTRVGAEHRDTVCKNKQWTQPDTACYCDCLMKTSSPDVSMKNLEKSKFLKHNVTLDWSCSNGATKAVSEAIVCTDGRLSAEPVCVSTGAIIPLTVPPIPYTVLIGVLGILSVAVIAVLCVLWYCYCKKRLRGNADVTDDARSSGQSESMRMLSQPSDERINALRNRMYNETFDTIASLADEQPQNTHNSSEKYVPVSTLQTSIQKLYRRLEQNPDF